MVARLITPFKIPLTVLTTTHEPPSRLGLWIRVQGLVLKFRTRSNNLAHVFAREFISLTNSSSLETAKL